jgi:FlaG/FlaF family flagellin (archaellin)
MNLDLKTIAVAVSLAGTLATSVGTYFVLQYRVDALESQMAERKSGERVVTQLVCDVHEIPVCPGGKQ